MSDIIIGLTLIFINVIVGIPNPGWHTVVGCTFAGMIVGIGIMKLIVERISK